MTNRTMTAAEKVTAAVNLFYLKNAAAERAAAAVRRHQWEKYIGELNAAARQATAAAIADMSNYNEHAAERAAVLADSRRTPTAAELAAAADVAAAADEDIYQWANGVIYGEYAAYMLDGEHAARVWLYAERVATAAAKTAAKYAVMYGGKYGEYIDIIRRRINAAAHVYNYAAVDVAIAAAETAAAAAKKSGNEIEYKSKSKYAADLRRAHVHESNECDDIISACLIAAAEYMLGTAARTPKEETTFYKYVYLAGRRAIHAAAVDMGRTAARHAAETAAENAAAIAAERIAAAESDEEKRTIAAEYAEYMTAEHSYQSDVINIVRENLADNDKILWDILVKNGGNKTAAAAESGVSHDVFNRLVKLAARIAVKKGLMNN